MWRGPSIQQALLIAQVIGDVREATNTDKESLHSELCLGVSNMVMYVIRRVIILGIIAGAIWLIPIIFDGRFKVTLDVFFCFLCLDTARWALPGGHMRAIS